MFIHARFLEQLEGVHCMFMMLTCIHRAHAAGWSYVILSDSLIVRQFSCKPTSLITV